MMLSSVDLGLPPWETVAFLTSGLALSSFAFSGHVIKISIMLSLFTWFEGPTLNILVDKQCFIVRIKISLVNMQAFSW